MKTKFVLLVSFIMMTTMAAFSQQQQRTVEERVKDVIEKIKTPLALDEAQVKKVDSVYTAYYTAQRKMREEIQASGERPDRSVFEKMNNDRDEKLKAIFTEAQFDKFKKEVEPTLRPQRRNN